MGKAKVVYIMRLLALAVLCAAVFLFSCSGGTSGLVYIPEYLVWINKYLPYVESVELPETIRANEAFNITVRLSAVLKPEILKAYDLHKPELVMMDWLPGTPKMLGIDFTIHGDITATGKEIDEIVYEVPPLSKGDYLLRMSTADSREWGGLDLTFNMGSSRLLYPENEEHRSVIDTPFTVLPADGDGGA